MLLDFEFKVLGAMNYVAKGGELEEDGQEVVKVVKYTWIVPDDIEKEAIAFMFAEHHGISLRQAEDIFNEWDIYDDVRDYFETDYNDDVEDYIRNNYETSAYNDYYKENHYWDEDVE